jgi:hypothetical protein
MKAGRRPDARRGERGWVGKGGPLWSPAGDGSAALFLSVNEMNGQDAPPTGDHKGPPSHFSPHSPLPMVMACLVTLSRSEGSVALGREMLRGVYTEHSECAQHDRAVLLPRHPIPATPRKTALNNPT